MHFITPSRIENARGNVTLPLESPTFVGDLNRQRCNNNNNSTNSIMVEAAIRGIANTMHESVRELRSEQNEVIELFQKMVETTNKKILYMDEQMRYQDSMLISQRELIIQLQTQMSELRNDILRRSYNGITRIPAVIPYDDSDSDGDSDDDDSDINVSLRQGHPRSASQTASSWETKE